MWSCALCRLGDFILVFLVLSKGDCLQFYLTPGLPQKIVIPPNETSPIYVQSLPSGTLFAVVQIHTQRHNISISTRPKFVKNSTKIGTSVGMTTLLAHGQTELIWYLQTATSNLTAVAYVQLYTQLDPIPGGCNQVFNIEIDPSVVLTTSSHSTNVWFQWSNLATPPSQYLPDCESTEVRDNLNYDVYVSFVQQRDLSEESFFNSIEVMLNPDSILDNGINVYSVKDGLSSKSQVTVTSETSQGAVYAVVVTRSDTGRQAAYVTAVTYACDFEEDNCSTDRSALEIVFAVVLCVCGLFLLILGHSFFKTMLFLFGFNFTALLTYILLSLPHTMDDSVKLPVASALGVLGGCLWTALWYFCAIPIVSVFVPGMCTGYLIALVLFFTPFGNIWWWDTALNYSIAFVCVVLLFCVLLMAYTKVLSILSCGIVGAFMLLLCPAILVRSSLRLMFLNALYHQIEDGYVTVKVVAPFHSQDIVLAALWPSLAIAGVIFQLYKGRNKPPFQIPARNRQLTSQVQPLIIGTEEDSVNSNNDEVDSDDERARLLPRVMSSSRGTSATYQSIPFTRE